MLNLSIYLRAITLVLGLGCCAAQATVLAPVNLFVEAKSRATTLQVTNDGPTAMSMDVRVMLWRDTGADAVDVLEPTIAVLASRPVLTIPPSQTATVRFLVLERSNNVQDNYRVILNDITPKTDAQVSVRMRQILPLFVRNSDSGVVKLTVTDGLVTNTGSSHARVTAYRNIDGKKISVLRYILPGKSVKLPVKNVEDITYNESAH